MVEAGHAESGSAYAAGLEAYADGSVNGVKSWLLRCAAAVARGAELSPIGEGALIVMRAERVEARAVPFDKLRAHGDEGT